MISLIAPVFNEMEMVDLFYKAVVEIMDAQEMQYEILYVNDGSSDATLEILTKQSSSDPRVRIIDLSRNFGKEAALTAGIARAKGDALVLLDVDLQDPPELIELFLAHWRDGYDVVYGLRINRDADKAMKKLSAGAFYRLFNRFSSTKIPENAGDFRLLDRKVADVLNQLPERNRFMKGLFAWAGFRSIGVPYQRPERAAGKTKWNYWKLWNFALDGLVGFSTVPLRIWTYVGLIASALSFVYGSFIIIRTLLYGIELPGYASLMTVVLFLGGIQLLSIGVIGEYIGRLVLESKQRPIFVINTEIQNGEELNVVNRLGTSGNSL
jgi:glycosyltransferase involved in cell wall biosynthesis